MMGKIVFEATFPMQRIKNRFYDGLLSLWTNKTNLVYVLTPFNLYRCSDDTKGDGKELYPKEDYFRGGYLKVGEKARTISLLVEIKQQFGTRTVLAGTNTKN